MPIRKEDWVEINRIFDQKVDALKPRGFRNFLDWAQRIGIATSYVGIMLTMLGITLGALYYSISRVSAEGTFQQKTSDRLDAIEKKLDALSQGQTKQSLATHAAMPPSDFEATLPDLRDSLSSAKQSKLPVDASVMDDLQNKLTSTSEQAPEYWPATAELVSYRIMFAPAPIPEDLAEASGAPRPNTGDCFNGTVTSRSAPGTGVAQAEVIGMHDCTLDLGNLEEFRNRKTGTALSSNAVTLMNLVRVNIVYRGGAIIPVAHIAAYNCTFDFRITNAPSPQGQHFLKTLLAQDFTKPLPIISVPS